jgi:hypothetical protein
MLFVLVAACGTQSPPSIVGGVYRMSSARLYHAGRFRELVCKGDIQFSLATSENRITVDSAGESLCEAAQPASFSEVLGGKCLRQPVHFYRDGLGESYVLTGTSMSCDRETSPFVLFHIGPTGIKSFRLTHFAAADQSLRSEFTFESL